MKRLCIVASASLMGLAVAGGGVKPAHADYYQEDYQDTFSSLSSVVTQHPGGSSGTGHFYHMAQSYYTDQFSGAAGQTMVNRQPAGATSSMSFNVTYTWITDPEFPATAPAFTAKKYKGRTWNLQASLAFDTPPPAGSDGFAVARTDLTIDGANVPVTTQSMGSPALPSSGSSSTNSEISGVNVISASGSASVTSKTAIQLPAGSSGSASAQAGSDLTSNYNGATVYVANSQW